jgi:hypothetical protein
MNLVEKSLRPQRGAAAIIASLVAVSVLLPVPAVAAPHDGTSGAFQQQGTSFDEERLSIRPLSNQGTALTVGDTRPSAAVSLLTANEGRSQVIVPERQSDGSYFLTNAADQDRFIRSVGFNLAAIAAEGNPAATVHSRWTFDRQSNGTYLIRPAGVPEGYLGTSGANGQFTTVTTVPTEWILSPIGGSLVDNANYTISWMANHAYSLNVDSAPLATPGANAVLARTFGFPTQWWRVEYNPEFGTYRLRNLNNLNVALDWNTTTNGATIGTVSNRAEQQWIVRPGTRGGWEFINLAIAQGEGSIRALDNHNSIAIGRVSVSTYDGSAGQEWFLPAPQR